MASLIRPFLFTTASSELEDEVSALLRCCETETGRDREQLRVRDTRVPTATGPRVVTAVWAVLSACDTSVGDEVCSGYDDSQLSASPVGDSMASLTADNLKFGMDTRTSYHSFYRP